MFSLKSNYALGHKSEKVRQDNLHMKKQEFYLTKSKEGGDFMASYVQECFYANIQ